MSYDVKVVSDTNVVVAASIANTGNYFSKWSKETDIAGQVRIRIGIV